MKMYYKTHYYIRGSFNGKKCRHVLYDSYSRENVDEAIENLKKDGFYDLYFNTLQELFED